MWKCNFRMTNDAKSEPPLFRRFATYFVIVGIMVLWCDEWWLLLWMPHHASFNLLSVCLWFFNSESHCLNVIVWRFFNQCFICPLTAAHYCHLKSNNVDIYLSTFCVFCVIWAVGKCHFVIVACTFSYFVWCYCVELILRLLLKSYKSRQLSLLLCPIFSYQNTTWFGENWCWDI